MLPDADLAAVLRDPALPLTACTGTWVHVARYRYAATLLNAEGAKHADGRFHESSRNIPALYLAKSPITALLEVRAALGDAAHHVVVPGPPLVLVAVEIELPGAILDPQ